MKDVENLIQSILKKALVDFTKETKCGMIYIKAICYTILMVGHI